VSAHHLPAIFAALAPLLGHGYGYLWIALLIGVESIGVPVVPGETILIAGAVYAGAGRLNIVAIGLIAVAAAIAGSTIGYAIGRIGGRVLVLRYGRYVRVTSERLDKAERFIDRRGWLVVMVARFVEGLRQAVGLVAGITGMRWPLFLACNAVGAVAWVAVWASVGDLAGSHITVIYQDATRYSLYALIALAILIVGLVTRYTLRRRRRRRRGHGQGESESEVSASAADPAARETDTM
jgi:membrane protein DedA with SNARE-associated domain